MHYDVIVLGTGGIGSAALYHLARRGASALGLDQFGPAHDRGSSHGHTRVIREAYFEHSDYVPLIQRAYDHWHALDAQQEADLLLRTGVIEVGPDNGLVIPSIIEAAKTHSLLLDTLDQQQVAERYPGFQIPPDMRAIYEPSGGVLMVEDCIRAHLDEAQKAGAHTRFNTVVQEWHSVANGDVEVQTDTDIYQAKHLVITAGPWTEQLLHRSLPTPPLNVLRKHLHWFADDLETYQYARDGSKHCPAFLFETPVGLFYGMPALDHQGVKVSEHSGGEPMGDPSAMSRHPEAEDDQRIEQFVATYLPQLGRQRTRHETCMYTMSSDGHFIIDHAPGQGNVSFCAGLSGHGFKFAPVLGEILADLALDGQTSLPCGFLSLDRF